MANHISPAAQLFRGMAELIDHDHTSQTHYEAVTKAAAAWRPAPAPSSCCAGEVRGEEFLYELKPAFGRAGRGLARGGAPTPPCSAAAGPRLVELNLREPTIPASSAYVH